jgi:hypothetical protein
MTKQRFIFTKISQSKDLSLQKYHKAKIFLYKNITKQRFFFAKT